MRMKLDENNTIVLNFNKSVIKIMVISDTHLCCKQERLDLLEYYYEKAEDMGIDLVIHCGDVVDGFLRYYNQQANLLYNTYEEQKEYVIAFYPKSYIPTIMISGNHDKSWLRLNSKDIVADITSERKDLLYLGDSYGIITIGNLNIVLVHGHRELERDLKRLNLTPNLIFRGHKHEFAKYIFRTLRVVQIPCLVDHISHTDCRRNFTLGAYYIRVDSESRKVLSSSLMPCESKALKRSLHLK